MRAGVSGKVSTDKENNNNHELYSPSFSPSSSLYNTFPNNNKSVGLSRQSPLSWNKFE